MDSELDQLKEKIKDYPIIEQLHQRIMRLEFYIERHKAALRITTDALTDWSEKIDELKNDYIIGLSATLLRTNALEDRIEKLE